MMANMDIRFAAKAAGVPFWKLGEKLGVSEVTIVRRLRKELSADQKKIYFDAIQAVITERARADLEQTENL